MTHAALPPFMITSYLSASAGLMPGYGTGVMPWPDLSMPSALGFSHSNMPANEVAIHRGALVQTADGRIGVVEELGATP